MLRELPDSDTRHSLLHLGASAKAREFIDPIFQVLDLVTEHICFFVFSGREPVLQYVLQPPKERGGRTQDPYTAVETDVKKLGDLLDQAWAAIEADDGKAALDVLEPLADELMNEVWLALSYDDSQAIFEFFDEVDTALAEALLTADLSDAERDNWEARLQTWQREMESYTGRPPYSVALDVVQREMRADSRYAVLWDGNPPWYAEDVICRGLQSGVTAVL